MAVNTVYRPASERRKLASSLGATAAMVRLLCSFISVKLTAVYLGPSGLAIIAQFNNFMTLVQGVVVTGLETASGRLTAEYGPDPERRKRLLGTVGKIGLGLGIPLALLVMATSPWLASLLLHDQSYSWVFVLGAVSLVAAIVNAVLLGTLGARGDIVRVVISNIIATITGVSVFATASVHWGVTGGLYASAAVYSCSLLITLALIARSTLVRLRDLLGPFDRVEARRVASFYPMLVVHAVTVPLSLLLIRQNVASTLSLEAAGLWQACWRLSETYLMVVSASVTTQFMVRLGEAANFPDRLRAEMLKTLGQAVGATMAMALVIFVAREWIVRLLFSSAFMPVTELIGMQLVGDVFKMIGFTCGFVMVATLRSRWYIAIQIVVPLVFIGLARHLGGQMGVPGVTMAYTIAGILHTVLAIIALRDLIFMKRTS